MSVSPIAHHHHQSLSALRVVSKGPPRANWCWLLVYPGCLGHSVSNQETVLVLWLTAVCCAGTSLGDGLSPDPWRAAEGWLPIQPHSRNRKPISYCNTYHPRDVHTNGTMMAEDVVGASPSSGSSAWWSDRPLLGAGSLAHMLSVDDGTLTREAVDKAVEKLLSRIDEVKVRTFSIRASGQRRRKSAGVGRDGGTECALLLRYPLVPVCTIPGRQSRLCAEVYHIPLDWTMPVFFLGILRCARAKFTKLSTSTTTRSRSTSASRSKPFTMRWADSALPGCIMGRVPLSQLAACPCPCPCRTASVRCSRL